MNVVFLGTNGWYDSPAGHTVCILIDMLDATILLDGGSGLSKADRYFSPEKPVHLFLSHLHLDHIIGLHVLNKFDLPAGLTIHCRKGDLEPLQTVIGPPYSLPFSALPYPVRFIEHDGQSVDLGGFTVHTASMRHSVPTIGFRIETDGKSVVYCPDTGYCESAVELAQHADLLIAECAFRTGEESEHWPHLNPETAAKLAFEAQAKRLVLIHFDAFRYPDMESRRGAALVAQKIFSEASATFDDQIIEI